MRPGSDTNIFDAMKKRVNERLKIPYAKEQKMAVIANAPLIILFPLVQKK